MSTVKAGWLKDNSGDKFAPKTLVTQVISYDGTTLDQELDTKANADVTAYIDEYDVSNDVDMDPTVCVDLSSDQSVYGVKSFHDGINIGGGANLAFDPVAGAIVISFNEGGE